MYIFKIQLKIEVTTTYANNNNNKKKKDYDKKESLQEAPYVFKVLKRLFYYFKRNGDTYTQCIRRE